MRGYVSSGYLAETASRSKVAITPYAASSRISMPDQPSAAAAGLPAARPKAERSAERSAGDVRAEVQRGLGRDHEHGRVEADPLLEPLVELEAGDAVDEQEAVEHPGGARCVRLEDACEEAVVLTDGFVGLDRVCETWFVSGLRCMGG